MGRPASPGLVTGSWQRPVRRLAAPVAAVAALALPGTASAAVGAPGVGDPYFPNAGNGGYDVTRYALGLRYAPGSRVLRGNARIKATATHELDRFNLDLRGLRVRSVEADGEPAEFSRSGQELQVTPPTPLAAGARFTVRVRYRGRPRAITDPDGSKHGWITTPDGALAPSEPQGAPTWFPANDHPTDKAAFRLRITVPRKVKAISNGVLLKRKQRRGGRRITWVWNQPEPMATYLATVAIGRFKIRRADTKPAPSLFAVDPAARRRIARPKRELQPLFSTPRVVRYFTRLLGPYPFSASGGILDHAPKISYALETQARPIYTEAPSKGLVVHEVAHQWLGNSVTPSSWRDIWLNEGFAAWCEWIWSEDHGGQSAAEIFDVFYATSAQNREFWDPPPGDPGPELLFDRTVYIRGAMTLQALRERVGNETFFAILRAWVAENRYGNVSTADFIALAERESGMDLKRFFRAWLDKSGKPRSW